MVYEVAKVASLEAEGLQSSLAIGHGMLDEALQEEATAMAVVAKA